MGVNITNTDPIKLGQAGNPIDLGRAFNLFKSVEWVGPVAAGDRVQLFDATGRTICEFTCVVAGQNYFKEFGNLGAEYTGPLNLSLLDSGYVLIHRM
jgi:hypothetical protein